MYNYDDNYDAAAEYFRSEYVNPISIPATFHGASLYRSSTDSGLSLRFETPLTMAQAKEYIARYYSGWDAEYFL